MKTVAIIQARMGSTRFPAKVLDDIAGIPMLHHVVERTRYAPQVDTIVIATTTNPDDHILLKRAREWQVLGFAGSEHDVLKRFVAAANLAGADIIVRLTGDNPLFEPSFIDACVGALRREKADYCYVDGCILGTGVEALTIEALKKQDSLATQPHQREHVNPYIMEHPDEFKIVTVRPNERFQMPEGVRLTVDTKEDMKLVRRIYRRLYHADRIVSLGRTVELLKENPEWVGLNKDVFQKLATSSELEEAEAAEAAEAETEAAPEPEPKPKRKLKPVLVPVALRKQSDTDKLDKLMAEAVTKDEAEEKRKEGAPSLDDVLTKAQEKTEKKPPTPGELVDLLGSDEPEEPEQPEEADAPAEAEQPEPPEGEPAADEGDSDAPVEPEESPAEPPPS